jgi:hypothetical protein
MKNCPSGDGALRDRLPGLVFRPCPASYRLARSSILFMSIGIRDWLAVSGGRCPGSASMKRESRGDQQACSAATHEDKLFQQRSQQPRCREQELPIGVIHGLSTEGTEGD